MSCRRVATLTDAFLDGELPPEQTLEVEDHLVVCDACRERARFDATVQESVREAVIRDAPPSKDFEARLAGALRAERERLLDVDSMRPASARRKWVVTVPLGLAAAATLACVTWFNFRVRNESEPLAPIPDIPKKLAEAFSNPEQDLEEFVSYHTAPPTPQITDSSMVPKLEPEVGVPLRLPSLKQYGAHWQGGSVIPVHNNRAAIFRYDVSNHPVTVYVYDTRQVRLRGVLEPTVVHDKPVHVGVRHGYSIAAREQRGVGYAVATDLDDGESAELVSTMY
jgi:anti-sigma factor RsiW